MATAVDALLWRRFPIRGPGRFVIPRVARRAARERVVASGPFGTEIEVDPAHAAELNVYLWGSDLPEVEFALGRLLLEGATVVEAGAGTGVMTAVIGSLCRPGAVIAVEPSAELGARLRAQAARNRLAVELVTGDPRQLDALLAGRPGPPPRVDLLRILVTGGEPAVLRGARALLARDAPALVFDWCPTSWAAAGEAPAATAELLDGAGYALYAPVMRAPARWSAGRVRCEGFAPASLERFAAGELPGTNVVALQAGPSASASAAKLTAPR